MIIIKAKFQDIFFCDNYWKKKKSFEALVSIQTVLTAFCKESRLRLMTLSRALKKRHYQHTYISFRNTGQLCTCTLTFNTKHKMTGADI